MLANSDSNEHNESLPLHQSTVNSGSAVPASVEMTPAGKRGVKEPKDDEPGNRDARRQRYLQDLEGLGRNDMLFESLLGIIGLYDNFVAFEKSMPADAFVSLANDQLVVHPSKEKSTSKVPMSRAFTEADYVEAFKRAVANIQTLPAPNGDAHYKLVDFQKKKVPGSELKPDLVFLQRHDRTPSFRAARLLVETKTPWR
ncbi:hypothetical protein GGI21_002895 [Coemansia aciculifera]|nr:hypothetical protein GGI21_002895 [Coemansia aciculifera]